MKNLVLFAVVLVGTALASCGGKKAQEAPAEEPIVEAVEAVEAVAVDTVAPDSIVADTVVAVEAVAE